MKQPGNTGPFTRMVSGLDVASAIEAEPATNAGSLSRRAVLTESAAVAATLAGGVTLLSRDRHCTGWPSGDARCLSGRGVLSGHGLFPVR